MGGIDDSTTGFTTLGARQYDPVTGRFLSADPVLDTADPQQMNGYAYANNNPTTDSDPSGLMIVAGGGGGCMGSIQYCTGHAAGTSRASTFVQGRPPWMSATTFYAGAPPPPPRKPRPPRPARPRLVSPLERYGCGSSWKAFWSGACSGEIDGIMRSGPKPPLWMLGLTVATLGLGVAGEVVAPVAADVASSAADAAGTAARPLLAPAYRIPIWRVGRWPIGQSILQWASHPPYEPGPPFFAQTVLELALMAHPGPIQPPSNRGYWCMRLSVCS